MNVLLLASDDELAGLRGEWSVLARGRPFQSPEWLLPWWRQFGTGSPLVAVARDDGRLAGVLACYVLEEDGARKVLPMGIGISDYLDALVAADAPVETVERLLGALLAGVPEGAACDLVELPPGSVLRRVAAPDGWRDLLVETTTCPFLVLPAGGELRRVIPAGTHRKLRMNRHRAARGGKWTRIVAGAADLEASLDALVRLHASRWDGRGEPGGVFADERVVTMLREAAPLLLGSGALRLHVLRVGDAIVAACLALAAETDRLMLYLSGFDAAHAFWSPGSVLLGEIVEEAIAEGRSEIDFLRGGEAYKYAWGAVDRFNADRRLVRA